MIKFVNAKINIGLNIVGKREDGYHLLQTVFYPVGLYAGSPANPEQFCDIVELTAPGELVGNASEVGEHHLPEGLSGCISYYFSGNAVDCPLEKNLLVKGAESVLKWAAETDSSVMEKMRGYDMRLDKHLPDGAGMGGGSADAVFAMRLMTDELAKRGLPSPDDDEMRRLAVGLGADCPVFVANRPAYAEGIGERLEIIPEVLKGKWLVVVKPDLHISTREAFSGVIPKRPVADLKDLILLPVEEWRDSIHNDFEDSLFPLYPELALLKKALYQAGALYASLTGSGAALYGVFHSRECAEKCMLAVDAPYKTLLLL